MAPSFYSMKSKERSTFFWTLAQQDKVTNHGIAIAAAIAAAHAIHVFDPDTVALPILGANHDSQAVFALAVRRDLY
jgi:cation transporter-like permease